MSGNLIKQLLRPRNVNRKNYKFIERTDEESASEKYHMYTLYNVLYPQFRPYDLYLNYFHSPFLAAVPSQSEQLTTQHISRFYHVFVEYVFLHCHLIAGCFIQKQEQKNDEVNYILTQIIGKESGQQNIAVLTREIVLSCFKKYSDLSQLRQSGTLRTYADVVRVQGHIAKLLRGFYDQVERQGGLIAQTQFLPLEIEKPEEIKMYVMQSFQKLQNLHVIIPDRKEAAIQEMVTSISPYVPIRVVRTHPFAKVAFQGAGTKEKLKNKLYVLLPRLSSESEPVITSLDNYIALRRKQRQDELQLKDPRNSNPQKSLKNTALELVKSLLAECRSFQKSTNNVYPELKVGDIMFDQKSLKPLLTYAPLIYDALGVTNRKHGSIQLEMSVNPTPSPLEMTKGYVEFGEAEQWSLHRKHYLNKSNKNRHEEQIQNEGEEIDQIQYFEGCPAKSKPTAEKAHVLRLISIAYFILHQGKHLVQDEYNKEYGYVEGEPAPFHYDLYRKTLKRLQNVFQNKRSAIPQMLKIEKEEQPSDRETFNFKLQELVNILNAQEKDPLLERVRAEKMISELWVREVLGKQISSIILNDKFFKKLLNAKKYTFLLLLGSISYCHQLWLPLKQENNVAKLRQTLTNLKTAQYRKLSFQKERDRKKNYIQNTHNKIIDYTKRVDEQNKYLSSNPKYVPMIQAVYRNTQKLYKLEEELMNEPKNRNDQAIDLQQMRSLICQTVNQASTFLNNLLDIELPRVERIDDFHKPDGYSRQQLYIITRKLFYLLKAFSTLGSGNWRKYQTLVLPILVDSRILGIETVGKRAQEGLEVQYEEIKRRMDQVYELLKNETPFELNPTPESMNITYKY